LKLLDRHHCPLGPTDWFYRTLVPKDPWENVEFRKWCLDKAWSDPEIAEELWIICSRDLLFYISVFGWLLEPRNTAQWQDTRNFGSAKEIPFLPRDYQEEAFLTMQKNLGKKDMVAKKSREMGATWMVLYLFDWDWRFHAHSHFGVVSKDEDSVDSPDDPDSLLAKMDFIDDHLPEFLRPQRDRNRTHHTILNRDNGSSITGYACTGNMARGGRKKAFFGDEAHAWPPISDNAAMDSLQHITHCRILISTPNRDRGQAGMFYDVCEDQNSDIVRFEWPWWLDKDKAAGLYRSDGNSIEIVDKEYQFPANYKFVRDGQTRSPYYDYECKRAGATEQSIAAELGMNFGGATSRFFHSSCIFKAQALCKEPTERLELTKISREWIAELRRTDRDNPIDVWIEPGSELKIDEHGILLVPEGRMYSMGVDIAGGKGGSYSSCSSFSIIDRRMSRQVAEYAYNRIEPEDFAVFCSQIGRVFNRAIMLPEITGVGSRFLAKILELQYPNLWNRPASRDDVRQMMGHRVGYDNKDGGQQLLGELQHGISRDKFTPRSKRAIAECERYYINSNGDLKHPLVGAGRADAPEKSHGDCAIAMGAAWFAIHSEPEFVSSKTPEEEAPYGGFEWRRQQYLGQRTETLRYWDPLESQQRKHEEIVEV
jgi:hypothetical protein